jgi:hypothetical protein
MAVDSAAGHEAIKVDNLMTKTCAMYYDMVRQSLQRAITLEVMMDGSRFRTRDTEIIQVYTCDGSLPEEAIIRPTSPTGHGGALQTKGFAANMPPLTHRELRWDAPAGSKPSAEDQKQFQERGFQAKPG